MILCSREFSGIFYVLKSENSEFSPTFLDFSFDFKSNFIVEKDNIQVKIIVIRHQRNAFSSKNRMFLNIYIATIPVLGMENFREFMNPNFV